jgi:hypothetical protein
LKTFTSFFFKTPKKRKTITVGAGTKRKRGHNVSGFHVEEEVLIEAGDDADDGEEDLLADEPHVEDDGQVAHDNQVVNTVKARVIREMVAKGICISVTEEKIALNLFPRVSSKIP